MRRKSDTSWRTYTQIVKKNAHVGCKSPPTHNFKEDKVLNKLAEQILITNATEIDIQDIGFLPLYDGNTDKYFENLECFIDWCKEEYSDRELLIQSLPAILWLCDEGQIFINARSIVEEACEDLHEDAIENIDYDDICELQRFLNQWCKKQTGTRTYYPDLTRYIKVREEWFVE